MNKNGLAGILTIVLVLILASVASYFVVVKTATSLSRCLPSNIKFSDVVEATATFDGKAVSKVTVEQKLNQIHASCQNNKLVDQAGKEISFYQLNDCWGNPPAGYQEIEKQQQENIDKLKERYTVIEMTCNPSGMPIL